MCLRGDWSYYVARPSPSSHIPLQRNELHDTSLQKVLPSNLDRSAGCPSGHASYKNQVCSFIRHVLLVTHVLLKINHLGVILEPVCTEDRVIRVRQKPTDLHLTKIY